MIRVAGRKMPDDACHWYRVKTILQQVLGNNVFENLVKELEQHEQTDQRNDLTQHLVLLPASILRIKPLSIATHQHT